MRYTVEIAGRSLVVEVDGAGVRLDGRALDVVLEGAGAIRRLRRGRTARALVTAGGPGGGWRIAAGGHRFEVVVLDPLAQAARAAGRRAGAGGSSGILRAPMPGLVVRVLVEPGQDVAAGTPLVVLEAMKMENELKAAAPGRVARVAVSAGARVEKGAPLVEVT